jgi:LmbE family N-acetylglucosaminyl deacetylase
MTGLGNPSGKRLAVVMPHPDDESYSCAGVMAMAADAGAEVQLITATRGESGWVRDPKRHSGVALAELRTAELEASCAAIGIGSPSFLDWPDGAVDQLPADDRERQLCERLDHFAPDVVITLATDGVYGHRDHVALTASCIAACRDRRLLLADFPRGLFEPLARKFVSFAGQFLVPDLDPGALGLSPGQADLEIDIVSVAARKRASIAAHDSQLVKVEPLVFLLPGLVEAVCQREWYTVADGGPASTVFVP